MNFFDYISGMLIGYSLAVFLLNRSLKNDIRRIIDQTLNEDMDLLCKKYENELIKRGILKE